MERIGSNSQSREAAVGCYQRGRVAARGWAPVKNVRKCKKEEFSLHLLRNTFYPEQEKGRVLKLAENTADLNRCPVSSEKESLESEATKRGEGKLDKPRHQPRLGKRVDPLQETAGSPSIKLSMQRRERRGTQEDARLLKP